MPDVQQDKSCKHSPCVCDSIVSTGSGTCHHMEQTHVAFANAARKFTDVASLYFSTHKCGCEKVFRETAQRCNTIIRYGSAPAQLRSASKYEHLAKLLKVVVTCFIKAYKYETVPCKCIDCHSDVSRSDERTNLLISTSNLIVSASLVLRALTVQHIKNSIAYRCTTSREALMELQLLPTCLACSLMVFEHANYCYANSQVQTCAVMASHTSQKLSQNHGAMHFIDWSLPSALCAIHWRLLNVITTKPEDFYLPDSVLEVEERRMSVAKVTYDKTTVRTTERPTTQELTDCRLSIAISDFNQNIYKYLNGMEWMKRNEGIPYYKVDQHAMEQDAIVKVCKVGLTIDQLESPSIERNVSGIRVFTRYFSCRTHAYHHLSGLYISRGGIIIPAVLESYCIMFILISLPLTALCALAVAQSFRNATAFTPVESSAALAAILVFAIQAYFMTRDYELDWGLVVQRKKITFTLDEVTARDLGITFDVLMNWIWYNRESYAIILANDTTCYLLTDEDKSGKTDVPHGLWHSELLYVGLQAMWVEDENGQRPQRQHVAVSILPDSAKEEAEERQCYLATISYVSGVHITRTKLPQGWYASPCMALGWTFSGVDPHWRWSKRVDYSDIVDYTSNEMH